MFFAGLAGVVAVLRYAGVEGLFLLLLVYLVVRGLHAAFRKR